MANKKTGVNEMASALGAVAPRADNLKPKRAVAAKHSKAKSAPARVETVEAPSLSEQEEISLVAYLYAERRGFQGGSQEEDWLRAEQEVRSRRG